MKHLAITLPVLIFSAALQADIEITIRDPSGRTSMISSNGESARMDDGRDSTYMLLNLKTNGMRAVDTRRREVMDMSAMADMQAGTAMPPPATVRVEMDAQGSGPRIAGYNTRKYGIRANGKNCGTVFGSRKVYALPGVSEIFSVFSSLQQQSQRMGGSFRAMLDECMQADLQMADQYKTIGAPLRVLDPRGQLESEVLSINTRASKPAGYYDAPANYRVTDMQQQMQQAQQQQRQMMQQMQNRMPDMNQMMQQMQQQPGMTPEAMEQMQKMQDMLKQRFQQQ